MFMVYESGKQCISLTDNDMLQKGGTNTSSQLDLIKFRTEPSQPGPSGRKESFSKLVRNEVDSEISSLTCIRSEKY